MSQPGRLDVIIVNHNTRDELAACLASLHEAPPAAMARIALVDNASTDDSVATVRRRWPAVGVTRLDRNRGFGAANNVAIRESSAEFVLLLNSDTVVPAGAIDLLLERLVALGAVAAGPLLVDAAGRPEMSFGDMLSPWTELRQLTRQRLAASDAGPARRHVDRLVGAEREVDWVSGACLLARRTAVIAAGGFDERYFLYEEDVDLCAALRAGGGRIWFTPRARVVHLRGRAMRGLARPPGVASHYDRSHLAFYEKHAPQWVPWLRRWLRLRGRSIG
jgi:N-acetylglucosaminyl-diphospho-decaprenol L-rhamnosyltransferase